MTCAAASAATPRFDKAAAAAATQAAAEEAAVGDEATAGCNSASPACSEATETTAVMVAATGWRRRIC